MQDIRILIVDNSPEFIDAAERYLAIEPRLHVVGHALSAAEALAQEAALRPHLVLIDYALPDVQGIEVTKRIKGRPGAPRTVIVAALDTPEYREQAFKAGADGLIAKRNFGNEMLPLIYALFPDSAPQSPANISSPKECAE